MGGHRAEAAAKAEEEQEAKRRRKEERKERRDKKALAEQAADEAAAEEEKREADRKRAMKEAEELRKARFQSIQVRVRRSKIWCSCGLPLHAEKCRLWGASRQLRWPGADEFVSRADWDWYLAQGGYYFISARGGDQGGGNSGVEARRPESLLCA